jgi:hypothetical protein
MDFFEEICWVTTGIIAGLGFSAVWGAPPVTWALAGVALFALLAGTGALIIAVRKFSK